MARKQTADNMKPTWNMLTVIQYILFDRIIILKHRQPKSPRNCLETVFAKMCGFLSQHKLGDALAWCLYYPQQQMAPNENHAIMENLGRQQSLSSACVRAECLFPRPWSGYPSPRQAVEHVTLLCGHQPRHFCYSSMRHAMSFTILSPDLIHSFSAV